MPTRALSQSVFEWPNAREVREALARWAKEQQALHPELVRLGFFGSYARGDWGVGSDLDLVVVVTDCDEPFERRGASWATEKLPVPADIVVYTEAEWEDLQRRGTRFARMLGEDAVWIVGGK